MNLVEELEDVLRVEQELLLKGNFNELERLVHRKSTLAQKLAEANSDLSGSRFKALAKKAKHNEALLDAARRGLQAAIQQIRQTAEATEQNTYTPNGERHPLARAPSSFTQKI